MQRSKRNCTGSCVSSKYVQIARWAQYELDSFGKLINIAIVRQKRAFLCTQMGFVRLEKVMIFSLERRPILSRTEVEARVYRSLTSARDRVTAIVVAHGLVIRR